MGGSAAASFGHSAEGALGGIEKAGSFIGGDDADEHGVGDAGDEVADVLLGVQRRHGAAVGFDAFGLGGILMFSAGNRGQKDAVSDPAAPDDGDVFERTTVGNVVDGGHEWRDIGHGRSFSHLGCLHCGSVAGMIVQRKKQAKLCAISAVLGRGA